MRLWKENLGAAANTQSFIELISKKPNTAQLVELIETATSMNTFTQL